MKNAADEENLLNAVQSSRRVAPALRRVKVQVMSSDGTVIRETMGTEIRTDYGYAIEYDESITVTSDQSIRHSYTS